MKGKTESVAMTANQVVGIYLDLNALKTKDVKEKKAIRRICHAIKDHEFFEDRKEEGFRINHAYCPKCEENKKIDFDAEDGNACPSCTGRMKPVREMWVPIMRKDRSFLWDHQKKKLDDASLAEEKTIREIAIALGREKDFDDLVADLYEAEDDDPKEPEEKKPDGIDA